MEDELIEAYRLLAVSVAQTEGDYDAEQIHYEIQRNESIAELAPPDSMAGAARATDARPTFIEWRYKLVNMKKKLDTLKVERQVAYMRYSLALARCKGQSDILCA